MKNAKIGLAMWLSSIALFGLIGCGGGGGGGGDDSTPNDTIYDISALTSLDEGSTYTIALSGSDSQGGEYIGYIERYVRGNVLYEGRDLIEVTGFTYIASSDYSNEYINSIAHSYYNQDKTLYKIAFDNGVTATPSNIFILPRTVNIGDQFVGQDLVYSNGNTISSDWEVVSSGDTNAKIIIQSLLNASGDITFDTISLIINPDGNILSADEQITDFPYKGLTTTFTGRLTTFDLGTVNQVITRSDYIDAWGYNVYTLTTGSSQNYQIVINNLDSDLSWAIYNDPFSPPITVCDNYFDSTSESCTASLQNNTSYLIVVDEWDEISGQYNITITPQ